MNDLAITPLSPQDRPRWTELWTAYLAFYETTLPLAQFDHTWARLMQGTELHGLAAGAGGALIGITHFLYHPHGWSSGPACYLQDLYVDASVRGTGAGRALIEAVAAAARGHGATRLYWLTQDTNAVARQLYDRLARHKGTIRYDYAL